MKTLCVAAVMMLITTVGLSQEQDTVIMSIGKSSRIIFTMGDPDDLEILKHYNFQQLFSDILKKLEEKDRIRTGESDTTQASKNDTARNDDRTDEDDEDDNWSSRRRDRDVKTDDDDDDDDYREWRVRARKKHRTHQSFNFDLGTNNILSNGKFPDDSEQYAVRPWGSWYVGLASVQKTRLAKRFFLEWGLGLSWYTFKFQDDNTRIVMTDNGVEFTTDPRNVNFIKSKLSASYLQASLVPVFDFGDRYRKQRVWDGSRNSFRLGVGPYAGYRISSRSKLVYNDGGREKDKDRDSFYLNNLRYGMRLQIGYRSTDLFFNYDMNELFKEGKGPDVNAFSFGVIF